VSPDDSPSLGGHQTEDVGVLGGAPQHLSDVPTPPLAQRSPTRDSAASVVPELGDRLGLVGSNPPDFDHR
jgi:hypothetical protein